MYKIYLNVKLKAVDNLKNVSKKIYQYSKILVPFNFEIRQIIYIIFFVAIIKYNNTQ